MSQSTRSTRPSLPRAVCQQVLRRKAQKNADAFKIYRQRRVCVCDSALVHVTSCCRGYTYTRSAARTILPRGRKLPKRKRSGLLTKRCPRCRKFAQLRTVLFSPLFSPAFSAFCVLAKVINAWSQYRDELFGSA